MNPASEWCEEMFGCGNWVMADEITIKAIQDDALQYAAEIARGSEACCNEGEYVAKLIESKIKKPRVK